MCASVEESKVVFREPDGRIRALRGVMVPCEDPAFVAVRRRDGTWRIRRETVLKIEPARDNGGF